MEDCDPASCEKARTVKMYLQTALTYSKMERGRLTEGGF